MTYQTFEFTAFTEADLVGSGNLNKGDSFTMPGAASVHFSVSDNDGRLSGDSWNNEQSDDNTGQHASIAGNGGELGNGGQIYAEVYHWVCDQHGNWYMLIEIEQEHSSEDFFTFHSHYGVPPAGAQLSVHSTVDIKSSGWKPDYASLGAGEKATGPDAKNDHFAYFEDETGGVFDGNNLLANDQDATHVEAVNGQHIGAGAWIHLEKGDIFVSQDGRIDFAANGDFDHLNAGETEDVTFTYTVVNASGGTDTATVKITVEGKGQANAAPTFDNLPANGVLHIDENNTAVIDIDSTDADGDSLTYEIVGGRDAAFFDIDAHTGELSFKSAPDFENPQSGGNNNTYDVTVKVSDGNGGSETKTLWVKVKDVDETPATGWIKGRFTHDADGNDNEWNNETNAWDEGIAGATIQLLDLHGNVVAESVTNAHGNYMFDVPAGDYQVKFPAVEGKEFSAQNSGVDEHFDSDADANGLTEVIHLSSGQTIHDIDAGVKETSQDFVECDDPNAVKIDFEGLAKGTVVDTEIDGVTISASKAGSGQTITIEAEHMHETGYKTVSGSNASGHKLERLTSHEGTLSTSFDGATGSYEVTVDVQDENDGQSTLTLFVDGVEISSITLDQDNNGGGSNNGHFSTLSFGTVDIPHGADVKIVAQRDGGEFVRVDKFTFEGQGEMAGEAMIFDSAHPTGGDNDLATATQGNILIISEDGDSSDPDDNAGGGTVTFDFDSPSRIFDLKIVDAEEGGTVTLRDADGNVIGTVDIPNGVNNGIQQIIIDTENVSSMDVTLNGSGAIDDICFVPPVAVIPASLGGTYFMDVNDNNIQDGADMAVAGATVQLFQQGTGFIASTTTDADGNYLFENLAPGDGYFVRFIDTGEGKTFVDGDVGGDDTVDSDVITVGVGGNGNTDTFSLAAGEDKRDVDGGIEDPGTASVGNLVFIDENGNGVFDGDDTGAEGVTVQLLDANGDVEDSTTTDANGNYSFDGLDAGTYSIRFIEPQDFDFTTEAFGLDDLDDNVSDAKPDGRTDQFELSIGETENDLDAGLVRTDPADAVIRGKVFMDNDGSNTDTAGDMGVAGVTVTLSNGDTVVTDAQGNYEFTGLPAGDYTVTFPTEVDGKVLVDANIGGDDTIDSDADQGTGATGTITLGIGEVSEDNDAGIEDPGTASLAGRVFMDNDGSNTDTAGDMGVAGVTVTLSNGQTVVTDGDGNYEFTGLAAGDYVVTFPTEVDGKVLVDANIGGDDTIDSDADQGTGATGTISLGIGERSEDNDAGIEDPAGSSISGRYFCDENDDDVDNGEPGIAGATVILRDAAGNQVDSTTTGPNGNYTFTGLAAGAYVVAFAAPADGKEFVAQDDPNGNGDDTNDSDVNDSGVTAPIMVGINETVDNVDAGVEDPGSASVGDTVWFDADGSGTLDTGEDGVANVVVRLIGAGADEMFGTADDTTEETMTDLDGQYLFEGLQKGIYKVEFDASSTGLAFTTPGADADDATDGDSDAGMDGMTEAFELSIGEAERDIDAGLVDPAGSEIRGKVFMDNDDTNTDTAGDMGVAGVTVTLSNGDTVVTDGDGNYAFTGLPAGDYVVTFPTEVDGKLLVSANEGGDDTIDSDADQTTGETGIITLGVNDVSEDNDAGIADPGTASVGDTVFVDANGDGVRNPGEVGLEGVTVTLLADLDGDGNVDDVVETVQTVADGSYLFSGLNAGEYAIQFGEPDNFDFTTPSGVAADAANDDSDAGMGGLTGTFNLSIGETELNIDAGVVAENGDPTPMDDMLKLCADVEAGVFVLDNDTDPDGDTLTITMVDGQAITEGGSVTTAAGTIVTLRPDGLLTVNGEAAYAALDIGEEAVESITYTVQDDSGNMGTANLDVTFCGDANSAESLAASLPGTATLQLIEENNPAGSSDEAFTIRITDGGARIDGTFTAAYCLQFFEEYESLGFGDDIMNAPAFDADIYAGLDSDVPVGILETVGINGETARDNLDLINWIINQEFQDQGFTDSEIQGAIWALTDGEALEGLGVDGGLIVPTGTGEAADAQAIVDLALANGEGFIAGENDIFTIIADPTDPAFEQPFIYGIEWEDIDCLCIDNSLGMVVL